MPDRHYTHRRLAEIYDLDSPWGVDTDFYMALAGSAPIGVLDLGCGTGTLCCALARAGHRVTGVDPAAAMLDVAKRKPGAANVEWIHSSAQTFRSSRRFELVVMTGHVFQVLLTDEDIVAVFETAKCHLVDGGVLAFESRNPSIDWAREWERNFIWDLQGEKIYQTRSELDVSGELISFSHTYRFPDETLVSASTLRFMSSSGITALATESGFQLAGLFGDWDGSSFDSNSSKEMIFILRAGFQEPVFEYQV